MCLKHSIFSIFFKYKIAMTTRNYNPRKNFPTALGLNRKVEKEHNPELFDYADHKPYKFLPVFPLIVTDEHLSYGKTYDVLYTHYTEKPDFATKPLLNYEHIGFWQDIRFHAERGEHFSAFNKQTINGKIIDFGICARKKMEFKKFQKLLDRLEDVKLIKRIRCQAKHFPVFIQICTPISEIVLEANDGKEWKKLYDRAENDHTANLRKNLGNKYPLIKWDLPTLISRLRADEPSRFKQFEALKQVIQEEINAVIELGEEHGYTAENLFERVKLACRDKRIFFSPKLYVTALGCLFVESDDDIDETHILAKL